MRKRRKIVSSNPDFTEVNTLLLFIGYPRSGSTLLGSILDAHPNIVIANEYNLLGHWKNYTRNRKTKEFVFNELWSNSRNEAKKYQRAEQKNYFFSYHVPGAWQGRYQGSIKVSYLQFFSSRERGKVRISCDKNDVISTQKR